MEFEGATETVAAFGMRSKAYTTEAHLHHSVGAVSGILGASGEYVNDANFADEHLMPDSKASAAGVYSFAQTDLGRWNLAFGAR